MHDIIPDIHGQGEKLHALLQKLGWRCSAAGWINDAINSWGRVLGPHFATG